jgi:transketolase
MAAEWKRRQAGSLPQGWEEGLGDFEEGGSLATRKSSASILKTLMGRMPELVGGSADLAGSNGTKHFDLGVVSAGDISGQMIHFGVREHAMGAICSGMSLHGFFRPFCATFLVFTDYMRPAMRLAALMEQPVVYVMTHDSIGLGEDGPTHQPVEHLAVLRAIPNMHVFRPGDANETREAWKHALSRNDGPTVLVFTRQGVPTLGRTQTSGASRGGYIVAGGEERPDAIIIGTGSELSVAMEARETLEKAGVKTRVVSMPCQGLFLQQDKAYRDEVLPEGVTCRVAVEAASPFGWHRFVGMDGEVIGMNSFGASAPAPVLFEKFGITATAVVEAVQRISARA